MAQASRTRTAGKHAATTGKRAAKAGKRAAARWRPGPAVEIGGLVIGIVTGLCLSLGLLSSSPAHRPPAPAATRTPLVTPGSAVNPAALDAEWAAYSDRSRCADWAGGDGVSAIRLNSSQLAWFFSDTYLGPAGAATGFSHISGFVNNSVVIQTTVGHASSVVTMTGGGACPGPGRPGRAAAVVAPPAAPGGPSDRYWDEDGIRIGQTVVKFYNRYLAGNIPFVPAGTVIATFPVSQLSAAGRGPAYGAVARPALVALPSWTPPGGGSPVIWGAALLRAGNTVYVYGTQSPPGPAQGAPTPPRQLYLARVPVSRLTAFSAWRFYAGGGQWAAAQQDARPVQPSGPGVSSGFSVVAIGGRYWLIQAGAEPGSQDIDAYPASEPWGPFDPAAGLLLYRNPAVGLDAAHDYRIMYEARAEPALSTSGSLVISYNVNSEAVTSGCTPMSAYTNTVTQPRFVSVPLTAFGSGTGAPRAASAAPGYPRIVPRHPSQWFNAWSYPGGCPPVPGLTAVHARPGPGTVKLNWPDAGLGVRYQVYLQGPSDIPAATAYGDGATFTGLRPGAYLARVVPVNTKLEGGPSAQTTFVVP
jgi:hypothetical protein